LSRPIIFEALKARANDAVYGDWLGHSADELATLKAEGVVIS
jgi:hypothetical protein